MNNVEVIKVFNNPSRLKRVAGYARVSTADEHQDSSYTLQTEELEQEIKSNPRYEFIGIFKDKKSGRNTKHRTEFNAMIELALLGEIDIIITKSITRFARNILDTISIVRNLKNHNVEVIFQKENISSLDPSIEFVLSVLAMHAEEESNNISANNKWSVKKRIARGENLTVKMYGYEIDGEDWTIIESEARVIRLLYDMYLNGKSYKTMIDTLYTMGIKTSTGKDRWHTGTLEQILQNEKYAGHMALGKSYIVNGNLIRTKRVNLDKHFIYNHHEPIISQETFDRAIALRESRSIGESKAYMPMSERITNYANYVYCVENEKYLRYVVERPKGLYEIPTLFCYNKAKKNRMMISVKNLMLLLMDAVNKIKESQQLILNKIGTYLNDHISKTNIVLQDDNDNKIDVLTFKTKLLSAKKKVPNLTKLIKNFHVDMDIENVKHVFSKVNMNTIDNYTLKLNLIDNDDFNLKVVDSSILLKLGYKLTTVSYSIYI